MSRRPNLIPSIPLTTALPSDVHGRLTLHLYSELEGRVPHGAYARFIIERTREYFEQEHIDLSTRLDVGQASGIISGEPATLKALIKKLEEVL